MKRNATQNKKAAKPTTPANPAISAFRPAAAVATVLLAVAEALDPEEAVTVGVICAGRVGELRLMVVPLP